MGVECALADVDSVEFVGAARRDVAELDLFAVSGAVVGQAGTSGLLAAFAYFTSRIVIAFEVVAGVCESVRGYEQHCEEADREQRQESLGAIPGLSQ
jgi:hypothetical protein